MLKNVLDRHGSDLVVKRNKWNAPAARTWRLLWKLVSPARLERATYALGGRRAIQLRHGDFKNLNIGME